MDARSLDLYEERINAITHGVGVLLALIAAPYLLMKANDYGKLNTILAVSVFLFGMLMCYLSSTVFHALPDCNRKRMWLIADHISIFFMIGGTYTPLVHKYVDDSIAVPFLGILWSLIAAGSILKLFFTGRYEWLSTIFYVFLGWMLLFIIEPVSATMPPHIFWWVIGGGLAYTVGVIFYRWRRPFAHCVWHLFVLTGTCMHLYAIHESINVQVQFG